MLSISSIKGSAGYYSHEDNYYISGSLESRWLGEGAEQLGLSGPVQNATLDSLRQGKLPDGTDLSRMVSGVNKHRSGYDLTFSAPKSVSVMALVGGDNRFIDAHNRAMGVAMKEVEGLVSARITAEGKTDTVLTGNMVAALFNHDTSRALEPQVHTHALVLNLTFADDKWRALASDTRMKTGFAETVYATQIALGKIYQHALRHDVEGMGFETVNTGKNGLWEIKGVPVEPFSSRSKAISEAAGPDASKKSRDVAALDTREAKAWADPDLLIKDWQRRLEENGFDISAATAAAAERVREGAGMPLAPEAASKQRTDEEPLSVSAGQPGPAGKSAQQHDKADGIGRVEHDRSRQQEEGRSPAPDVGALMHRAVSDAISILSDKSVQFTWSELLAGTVNQLPAEPGVFARARTAIDEAIEQQRLVPLDREKGIFTSDIHLLNELSVQQLARDAMQGPQILTFPEHGQARDFPSGDAISVLGQDRHPLAILSGKGGASVQRERIMDATQMAREQGRDVVIIAADARSGRFLSEENRLSEHVMQRSWLKADTTFPAQSTLILEQAEKLSLKDTLLVLERAQHAGSQVLFMDSENRQGTGNALSVLKNADVPQYRFYQDKLADVTLISESDKRTRYGELAHDYVRLSSEGREVVAQVAGSREQAILTETIRSVRQDAGLLGKDTLSLKVLEPVWLDSKTRKQRDNYREGMVLEQWDAQRKTMQRYDIHRVAEHAHSLVIKGEDGSKETLKLSQMDGTWSLYRARTLTVASGEDLRVLGREARGELRARDTLTVTGTENGMLTVQADNKTLMLPTDRALKLAYNYVEGAGASVGDERTVLAAVGARGLNQDTLTQLARSGSDVRIYTPLAAQQAEKKVQASPAVRLASQRVTAVAGDNALGRAIDRNRDNLMTPTEQAVALAVPRAQQGDIGVQRTELLAQAMESGLNHGDIIAEIDRQIKQGELIDAGTVPGLGHGVLVPRMAYEMEKSIIHYVAEGKEAVSPLMSVPPASVLEGLTRGQRNATRMILESRDRFTAIQGYAGVGKTTQYRAVMKALSVISPAARPEVIGLGPTHRAVLEMQDAGVKAQTISSFLSESRAMMQAGENPDFSNVVFLTDESSMVGNRDAAELYRMVSAGNGRMVSSGDTAQLQAIASGQPFRLVQQRSAIDTVVMKEIVRQTPELRPAIESMIARNVSEALNRVDSVSPAQVPRQPDAWVPAHSVMEVKQPDEGKGQPELKEQNAPENIIDAIVRDWMGRTPEAQKNTLIEAHLNVDRREINQSIHAARRERGEVGHEERAVLILIPERVPDNALRSAGTFSAYTGRVAMMDQQYYTVADVDKEAGVVALRDADGKTTLISPQENSTRDISLYRQDTLYLSTGDRVRFSRSDNDRGYVANSLWEVSGFTPDNGVIFSNGDKEKLLKPGQELADRHIDLAYAVTAYGAQGASSPFAITLEGTDGARRVMTSLEASYVTMSRSKEHLQVYTDDRKKWIAATERSSAAFSAHDILHFAEDREGKTAASILSWASPLEKTALGRRVLSDNALTGTSMARFVAPGKKYPEPHVALPVWSQHGRHAGVLLNEVRLSEARSALSFSEGSRLLGGDVAQFAGLQASRNGETLMADSAEQALAFARDNPDSGVVIRLSGDERDTLLNAKRLTGGDIVMPAVDDAVVQEAAMAAEEKDDPIPFIPDVPSRQAEARVQENAVQQVAERLKEERTLVPEDKPDLKAHEMPGLTQQEREQLRDVALLPERDMDDAVRDVALQSRDISSLSRQQMERAEREFVIEQPEKVLTLEEKTLGE